MQSVIALIIAEILIIGSFLGLVKLMNPNKENSKRVLIDLREKGRKE